MLQRLLRYTLALAAGSITLLFATTNAIAAGPAPIHLGEIESWQGQKALCLDDTGWSKTSGTLVQQWKCNRTSNQMWTELPGGTDPGGYLQFEIQNDFSHLCLDARNYGTKPGTLVQQWKCNRTSNQEWEFDPETPSGAVAIFNVGATETPPFANALDVVGRSTSSGAHIQLWEFNGTGNQLWVCSSKGCPSSAG
jgi:hypothetical protein